MNEAPDIPNSPSLNTQLFNAVVQVARAQDRLKLMREQVALARSNEADALDKVNEAQGHFDALVSEVKKSATPETDWRRRAAIVGF
jgi:chromosome segregation ATPase